MLFSLFDLGGCFLTSVYQPLLGSGAIMQPQCESLAQELVDTIEDCVKETCQTTDANAFNYHLPSKNCFIKNCTRNGVLVVQNWNSPQYIYADIAENFVYIAP